MELLSYTFNTKLIYSLHSLFREGGSARILSEASVLLQNSEYSSYLGDASARRRFVQTLYDTYKVHGNILGLPGYSLRNDYNPWSEDMISTLRFLVEEGQHSWEQIASLMGRTPRSVRWKHDGKDPGVKSNDRYSRLFVEDTFKVLKDELDRMDEDAAAELLACLKIRERLDADRSDILDQIQTLSEYREVITPQAISAEPEKNSCVELQQHERIPTMTEAVEPVKKGIWTQLSRSVGKHAARIGVTAGGAAITTLVYQVSVKGALRAGLSKETLDNPMFQMMLKMGIPTVLRAASSRLPVLQDVQLLDKMLHSAQHVALGQATRVVMNKALDIAGDALQGLLAASSDVEAADEVDAESADDAADESED